MVTIGHIVDVMEKIAPSSLAEEWDNIGLQVGHNAWPVDRIWVALDPTEKVVNKASQHGVNLLITHHPLIFQPLSALDPETLIGRIIETALRKRLGIFCAHTNLDSARDGLNDMLSDALGIDNTNVLRPKKTEQYKMAVFVPKGHEGEVINALFESGAGKGGKYTHLSFRTEGMGTFKPGDTAKPFTGRRGEVAHASEYRIEVLVAKKDLPQVIAALHAVHPYEEVVYDLYGVGGGNSNDGLGRVGDVDKEISLQRFAQRIKQVLGLETVRIVGDPKQTVRRVAVCSGSGKSLLADFLASDAQVFVSGDLGYHDGRHVEDSGRALIDIGHFASEHLVVRGLVALLRENLSDRGYSVQVEPYEEERDCFQYI